jgi:hypothetical protein
VSDLSFAQAIAQLQGMTNPSADELRALVAQIRVTQADAANLAFDRAIPIKATLLYSGTISKDYFGPNVELKAGQIANELAKSNQTLAIIDNSHVGRFLSSSEFASAAGKLR